MVKNKFMKINQEQQINISEFDVFGLTLALFLTIKELVNYNK